MSNLTSVTPPAAWYPDPSGKPQLRWWNGIQWTDDYSALPGAVPAVQQNNTVIVAQKKGVNHAFHLIMTICTFGLWLPVWIILTLTN